MVMSGRRKLLIFSCFVLIDALLLGGIILLREVTLKNVLNKEVSALAELDLFKDRYNSKIESHGDYALVEEAIKSYLDDYALEIQKVAEARLDTKLNSLTLVSNIEKDGPYFDKSLEYIDKYQNEFNEHCEVLASYLEENNINDYIYQYTDDKELVKMYRKLLKDNKIKEKLAESERALVINRIDTNSHIDAIRGVITFLKDNNGNYYIEDGEVKFNNTQLFAEYVKLFDKTKRIY